VSFYDEALDDAFLGQVKLLLTFDPKLGDVFHEHHCELQPRNASDKHVTGHINIIMELEQTAGGVTSFTTIKPIGKGKSIRFPV
jgi:hypothetical protein